MKGPNLRFVGLFKFLVVYAKKFILAFGDLGRGEQVCNGGGGGLG